MEDNARDIPKITVIEGHLSYQLVNVLDVLGAGRRQPFGRSVEPYQGLHVLTWLEDVKHPCQHEAIKSRRFGVKSAG